MRRDCLILAVLVVGFVLFLQIGCEEQAKVAPKSEPELTESEPAAAPEKAPPAEARDDEPPPKIVFEKVAHDFGRIGPGTRHTCEFKFTNEGDGVLKIGKIQTTCGCTVPKMSKREYAPGESGTLTVNYHAGTRAGRTKKRLYVPSNDKTRPKVALVINARIVPKIDYKPKRLKLTLKEQNADCPEITLTSLDGQPFAITRFKSTGNCITADYDPSVKATRFVIQTRADTEKLRKNLNGNIEISLTHPQCSKVNIVFSVLTRFKINPPSIIVFNVESKKPKRREVWILDNYNEGFEIESTSSKKGIIKVLTQEKVGNRYKFNLEITPPATEGKSKIFTDVFYVNIKGGEKLEIPCRGFYLKKK